LIVECQQCHARFRLDEARVPASGAKVRCSQCKTAFVVKRPGATPDDIMHEVVAEATDPGHARAPAPTEDLFERPDSHVGVGRAESTDEDHWEFDEAPERQVGKVPSPKLERSAPRPTSSPKPAAAPEAENDLDSLGSPTEWDLLTGAAERIAKEASFQPDPAPASPRATSASRARTSPRPPLAVSPPAFAPSPSTREVEAEGPAWRATLAEAGHTAARGAMWIVASGLCAAGLALAAMPARLPASAAPKLAFAAPDGVRDLSVRSLESAIAGRLTIVRAELGGGPPNTRVRVAWLDDSGRVLASALAGVPLSEAQLRELSLERIRAEHEHGSKLLASGGRLEAAYAELPVGAVGIAVTRERAPEPPAAPSLPTPSDPSALPSSE
jgi:predicted Zn finger-like uncharacterized protein